MRAQPRCRWELASGTEQTTYVLAEEGMNCGKTHVTAAGAVTSVLLEMIQECPEERSIQIRNGQFGRRFA